MFTGIIKDKGTVIRAEDINGGRRMSVRTSFDLSRTEIGSSIACDGCCLTVVEKDRDSFTVDISSETLSKTTLGNWQAGTIVNLEQSLKMGDEMGGHMVSGHVDGVATLTDLKQDGEAYRLTIQVPDALAAYIAPKGSVALNGVSLTVNEVEGSTFGVCIIPHTWDVTTIGQLQAGDRINLEVDMLARYVARILGKDAA